MSFDRLAPVYRLLEAVLAGGKLQQCRRAFLDQADSARRILLVGEGHGRCLKLLLPRAANAEIVCLDASGRMLDRARKVAQTNDSARVRFVQADVREWTPDAGGFDLIVTHFFLDCFPADQLGKVIAHLATVAAPQARWLVADFHRPPAGWRRWRAGIILWLMYRFFNAATRLPAKRLEAPDAFLIRHGFVLEQRQEQEWGLLQSSLWGKSGETLRDDGVVLSTENRR